MQEHTSKNGCSLLLLHESQVPKWLQHGWIFLEQLLLVCPAVCYLWGHGKSMAVADPHCSLPQALVGTALGQLIQQLRARNNFREREAALQSSSERQGGTRCNGLCNWSLSRGLSGHPLIAVTLGCPQKPSHHRPRSPSAPVSQLSNTIPLIPCRNQCDEILRSPTKHPKWAQGCSEKAVLFYYQINFKKAHPFHFPHQRS